MQPPAELEELRVGLERIRALLENLAVRGLRACGPDELVQMFQAKDINIVVTGGETQGAWRMFSGYHRGKATVSVDEWR